MSGREKKSKKKSSRRKLSDRSTQSRRSIEEDVIEFKTLDPQEFEDIKRKIREGISLRKQANTVVQSLLNQNLNLSFIKETEPPPKDLTSDGPFVRSVTLYNEAISIFKELQKQDTRSWVVHYYLALTHFEKATKLEDILGVTEFEAGMDQALSHIDRARKYKGSNDHLLLSLWGMILLQRSKKVLSLKESEQLLVESGEKLEKALELAPSDPLSILLLWNVIEGLTTGQKDRQRNGKAIYHIAGDLTKQGGSIKTWKNRWVVVDDTSISYYKDKADWELGAVQGGKARPKGAILLNDVLEITMHSDATKCSSINSRPKGLTNDTCLHVLTKTRTYNIVGFLSSDIQQEWVKTLKTALRLYNVKKKSKKFLNGQRFPLYSAHILSQYSDFLEIDVPKMDVLSWRPRLRDAAAKATNQGDARRKDDHKFLTVGPVRDVDELAKIRKSSSQQSLGRNSAENSPKSPRDSGSDSGELGENSKKSHRRSVTEVTIFARSPEAIARFQKNDEISPETVVQSPVENSPKTPENRPRTQTHAEGDGFHKTTRWKVPVDIVDQRTSVMGAKIDFSIDPKKDLTFDELGVRMRDVSNEEASALCKRLLKSFEKEGSLVKVMAALASQNPTQFIHDLTDISNFEVAKFGGLSKMSQLLQEFDK